MSQNSNNFQFSESFSSQSAQVANSTASQRASAAKSSRNSRLYGNASALAVSNAALAPAAWAAPQSQLSRSASATNNNNNVQRIVQDLLDLQRARRSAAASASASASVSAAVLATASSATSARASAAARSSAAATRSSAARSSAARSSAPFASAPCRQASANSCVSRVDDAFLSEVEQSILRAAVPVELNETEEITVNGESGVWANRDEVTNWKGPVPIKEYEINADANPEVITKRTEQLLECKIY